MNQDSMKPVPKVQAVGLAGSIVTLIVLIGAMMGIDIPADKVDQAIVGITALVSLITFVAGYVKKSNVKEVK